MTAQPESPELTARDLLAEQFRGWTIWTSDAGRYWATRRTELTEAEADAGFARTISADTPAQLIRLLRKQEAPA